MTTNAQHVLLTNITEEQRDRIAISVLKARLSFAIKVGRTDGVALASARRLADKYGWTESTKTMKQALRFVLACQEVWQ